MRAVSLRGACTENGLPGVICLTMLDVCVDARSGRRVAQRAAAVSGARRDCMVVKVSDCSLSSVSNGAKMQPLH